MNKQEFLGALKKRLSGLPKDEIEERLAFYGEMIDDRTEDGRTEEEAVAEIGGADEIAAQIIADIPLTRLVKERIKPKRRLKTWEIVLIVLGSPIWLSLAIAAAAVFFSMYMVLCALIVALWSVFVSLIAGAIAAVPTCIVMFAHGNAASGLTVLSGGLILAGLCIFTGYGCKAATANIFVLTKKFALSTKKCFIKKEEIQ